MIANESFPAGLFKMNPVTELIDGYSVKRKVKSIVKQFNQNNQEFPYIFIIGHANKIGLSYEERLKGKYSSSEEANWLFAVRRAAVIGEMIKKSLPEEKWNRLVIVSVGENDPKYPDSEFSQENAWVEILFGKKWKLPAKK